MSDLSRLDWIIAKVEAGPDKLTPWERDFIQDMADHRAKYGDRTRVSEKQWEVLENIAEKAA